MEGQTKTILDKPLEETGLSVRAIENFRSKGYTTIKSIILNSRPSYDELHERLVKSCKNETEKIQAQHTYNELLEYIKYYGIKCQEENNYQKTITR